MIKKTLIIIVINFLFSMLVFASSSIDSDQLSQYLQRVVVDVEISGNTVLSDYEVIRQAKLLTRIKNKTTKEMLETDLKSIYSLGYFSEVNLNFLEKQNGLIVEFTVVENVPVSKISFAGNSLFPNQELLALIQTKIGKVLNLQTIEIDINNIDAYYHEAAYDLARVDEVVSDPISGQLTINITEIEVEEITVSGNFNTADSVILREVRTGPGSIYNSVKLRQDRNRILALGYFSSISAPELIPGSDSSKIKLMLHVQEQKVNAFNVGAGASETEALFFFANLGFRNLFRSGIEVDLKSQFSEDKQTYSIRYSHPWFVYGPTRFTAQRWNTRGEESYVTSNLEILRLGYSAKFSYPFSDDFHMSIIYKSEHVEAETNTPTINYQTNSLALASIYSDLTYDPFKYVVGGSMVRFKAEQGGLVLSLYDFGGQQFERYDLSFSHFMPVFSLRDILSLRLVGGIYRPADPDLAVLEGDQYIVGGATTLRGILDKSSEVDKGARMVVVNLELRHAFSEYLQGVVFLDWGDAFGDTGDSFDLAKFRVGKGLGLRFTLSGFTVRFDYGWVTDYEEVTGGFRHKTGSDGVLHFSLGQMF